MRRFLNRNLIVLIVQAIVLFGCIDPYTAELPGGNTLLVVDGLITNEPGPYTVNLSLSSPLSEDQFTPVSNATVMIEEEGGPSEELTETVAGTYVTAPNGITGQAGNRYRLHVSLENGDLYQSDWSLLKPSPPIDSVYWEFQEVATLEGRTLEGVQLFVNTFDPENRTEFYRYEWHETWEYSAPLATRFMYLGDLQAQGIEVKRFCWDSRSSNDINIASSTNNVVDAVAEHKLNFVTTEGPELRIRYSILVKQLAISEDEYNYWQALRETSEESGGLFERQPQSVNGNMVNLTDPERVALGFFSASGVADQRIFIDGDELPEGTRVYTEAEDCEYLTISLSTVNAEEQLFGRLASGYVFVDFDGVIGITGFIYTTAECGDCTAAGGTFERPEFWIE